MKKININIEEELSERLDFYLANAIDTMSRTDIKKLIKDQCVLVNGKIKKPKYLLKMGDNVIINIPKPEQHEILQQDIPLNIIYQDEDIAIINKPQGMIVHPASGNYNDTLANALLYNFKNLSDMAGELRPGIVHRLDKDTSGLMIIAKNNFSHNIIAKNLKGRNIKREYIALVKGVIEEDKGVINEPIGRNPKDRRKMTVTYKNSKPAITYYEVVERFEKYTLVKAKLETGRTHQIRVHFSHINHPIIGDRTYSDNDIFNLNGQLLHSINIGFIHPRNDKYMEFSTEIPKRFTHIIKKLN